MMPSTGLQQCSECSAARPAWRAALGRVWAGQSSRVCARVSGGWAAVAVAAGVASRGGVVYPGVEGQRFMLRWAPGRWRVGLLQGLPGAGPSEESP